MLSLQDKKSKRIHARQLNSNCGIDQNPNIKINASTQTHLAQINLVLQFRQFFVEVRDPGFCLFELCLLTKNIAFDLLCWEGGV